MEGQATVSSVDINNNFDCLGAELLLTLEDYDPATYKSLREIFPVDEGWRTIIEKDYSFYDRVEGLPENLFNMDFNHACDRTDGHYSGESVKIREFHIYHNTEISYAKIYMNEEGKMIGVFANVPGCIDGMYHRLR